MHANRIDALARSLAAPAPRRVALRLLGAALLAALLPGRTAMAQRQDSDGDGLFDDDEIILYGTRPDSADTDGDGVGDGQEICNRSQAPGCEQDQVHTNPLVNENAAPPPADPAPPAATCIGLGGACSGIDLPCCGNDPATFGYNNVICCVDLTGGSACTDIAGVFLCPDPGVPATGCPIGQTNCGGFCTDVSIDHGNCGACGNACSQLGPDYNCTNSTCVRTCEAGLTDCFGRCVNLMNDVENCGGCGDPCRAPREDELIACDNGTCEGLQR